MAYVSFNYMNNPSAPVGKWTCSPTCALPPYARVPTGDDTKGMKLCGQCVSYVKKVCPTLPVTNLWRKGALVRNNKNIVPGTVIATFNGTKYEGHAAIYVSQNLAGVSVYDQYVTPP
jgi:hypothetical protein